MSDENKFDFSEDTEKHEQKDKDVAEMKKAVQEDAKGLYESISGFLSELLDFRHDTDRDATIAAIKADISFKGATAWILVCSIMVASVGLNANSTAVVIGAMLISPLMGPILGIGMSIAINDIDTLKRSLINLAIMIVLSLLTAFLFFRFFPLSQDTSELLGRVKPDIRDVIIAFFGGLALIIARTKKGTIASVIFGVAIATALMPPLCTAGYGLAKANWTYFGQAMYLFTINTMFIALATFIVLKVLQFPMLKYANSKKRKRIAQLASVLAVLVMVPAVFTFIDVYKKSIFEFQANDFIETKVKSIDEMQLFPPEISYEKNVIELSFMNEVSTQVQQLWLTELKTNPNFDEISNVDLKVKGSSNTSFELISDAYNDVRTQLNASRSTITDLKAKINSLTAQLNTSEENPLNLGFNNFVNLSKDAKIKFSDLDKFGLSKMVITNNFSEIDTINVAQVTWRYIQNDSIIQLKNEELQLWLESQVKAKVSVLND